MGMVALLLITFTATNLQAILWQSSDWLVGAVLPGVVIDLTNTKRVSEVAAAPLRRSAVLDAAATAKAKHMAANEYFAHYAPDGTTPWEFFAEAGYVYAHAGENLAIHFSDSIEVVEAWMKSPAHRANIVDGKFTEIGVGTARGTFDGYPTVYVVQLFGTPAALPVPAPAVVRDMIPAAAVNTSVASAPVPSALAVEPTPSLPAPSETELIGQQSDTFATVPDTALVPLGVFEAPATTTLTSTETVPLPATAVPEESDSLVASLMPPTTVLGATEAMSPQLTEMSDPQPILISDEDFSVPLAVPPATPQHSLYSQLATSSGLLALASEQPTSTHAGATITALATQPSLVFGIIYSVVAVGIVALLLVAAIYETRRRRFVQVAYSGGLLAVLVGLWYVHTLLTSGAVIV